MSTGSRPLGDFIRHAAADAVLAALGEHAALNDKASPAGAGNWAAVPWMAVFDPAITLSATRGYYVVYLFHATEPVVHLSLNQGTTAVREEFSARAREILQDRADLMRKRVPEFDATLPIKKIELGADSRLPGDYVAVTRSAPPTASQPCPTKQLCAQICKPSCAPIEH
jgi:5-methylcytosine-specific restriction enzyme A